MSVRRKRSAPEPTTEAAGKGKGKQQEVVQPNPKKARKARGSVEPKPVDCVVVYYRDLGIQKYSDYPQEVKFLRSAFDDAQYAALEGTFGINILSSEETRGDPTGVFKMLEDAYEGQGDKHIKSRCLEDAGKGILKPNERSLQIFWVDRDA